MWRCVSVWNIISICQNSKNICGLTLSHYTCMNPTVTCACTAWANTQWTKQSSCCTTSYSTYSSTAAASHIHVVGSPPYYHKQLYRNTGRMTYIRYGNGAGQLLVCGESQEVSHKSSAAALPILIIIRTCYPCHFIYHTGFGHMLRGVCTLTLHVVEKNRPEKSSERVLHCLVCGYCLLFVLSL